MEKVNEQALQRAFDKVVTGLRGQKRKSTGGGFCRFRGAEGAKCAIGWLIPDDQYSPDLEKVIIVRELQHVISAIEFLPEMFLRELRNIHDLIPPTSWEHEFAIFSQKWGLNFTRDW